MRIGNINANSTDRANNPTFRAISFPSVRPALKGEAEPARILFNIVSKYKNSQPFLVDEILNLHRALKKSPQNGKVTLDHVKSNRVDEIEFLYRGDSGDFVGKVDLTTPACKIVEGIKDFLNDIYIMVGKESPKA